MKRFRFGTLVVLSDWQSNVVVSKMQYGIQHQCGNRQQFLAVVVGGGRSPSSGCPCLCRRMSHGFRYTTAVLVDVKRNGFPEPLIKSGYIDTTRGIEITRGDVFKLLSALEDDRNV